MGSYSLAALAERIGAHLLPAGAHGLISGLGALAIAEPHQLSHLSNAAYRRYLSGTRAGAVLLRETDAPNCPVAALVVDDPYAAYARLSHLFAVESVPNPGVHPHAVIGIDTDIDASASVGPFAVVESGATIAAGVAIGAHSFVGAGAHLAEGVRLHPNVVIYHGVSIGARSIVHSGTVIGADGFGYARDKQNRQIKIAQLGGVRIGADVEVGAATTIDRGAIDDTVIEDGVKIDNQVQIGHNCVIGAHSVICGCVGIVGSTRIGRYCVLAGGVGVGGSSPITLADGVVATGMTHVSQSIEQRGTYSSGTLFSQTRMWKRNAVRFRDLDSVVRRLQRLEALFEQTKGTKQQP